VLVAVRVLAGHNDLRQIRVGGHRVFEFRIELLGDDEKPREAVSEHEAVIVFGEQRVDRYRHHAGLDRAEKRGRPIDGVEEAQKNALLAAHVERAQYMAEAFDALGEFAIGEAGPRIDIRKLGGAPGVKVALEDIGREIIFARNHDGWRARPQARLSDVHRGVSPKTMIHSD